MTAAAGIDGERAEACAFVWTHATARIQLRNR